VLSLKAREGFAQGFHSAIFMPDAASLGAEIVDGLIPPAAPPQD
jgi:hypothetical protein